MIPRILRKYKKIIYRTVVSLLGIVLFSLGTRVPLPFVNSALVAKKRIVANDFMLQGFMRYSAGQNNASIFTLGIGPYVTSSIFCSLLFSAIPNLRMRKKTEGNRIVSEYTTYLSIPISLLQSATLIRALLKAAYKYDNMIDNSIFDFRSYIGCATLIIITCSTLVAFSMFLTWGSDILTEHGLINGVSLLIGTSVMRDLPMDFELITVTNTVFIWGLAYFVTNVIVAVIDPAVYDIPLYYPRSIVSDFTVPFKTSIPLKVNQSGIVPCVFTSNMSAYLSAFYTYCIQDRIVHVLSPSSIHYLKSLDGFLYMIMIFAISHIYSDIAINVDDISEQIQNPRIGVVAGIAPGKNTARLIQKHIFHLNSLSASYLTILFLLHKFFTVYSWHPTRLIGTSAVIFSSAAVEVIDRIYTNTNTIQHQHTGNMAL